MALSEFEIIEQLFKREQQREDVVRGIGDDAALVRPPAGKLLAVATDTIVEGVHFPVGTAGSDIGYRALAVNLSDLAAMGAEPAWASLAISLPRADRQWLEDFASGFFELADRHQVQLIGGDTTRAALSVTVTVHGWLDGPGLLRSGARVGDDIIVSGTLGDAAAGLASVTGKEIFPAAAAAELSQRFTRLTPRVELGLFLHSRASAAIDISDGFIADLGHIVQQSGVGAEVRTSELPLSAALIEAVGRSRAIEHALGGGDDYELCFTLPPQRWEEVHDWSLRQGLRLSRVGRIEALAGMRLLGDQGKAVDHHISGYRHF